MRLAPIWDGDGMSVYPIIAGDWAILAADWGEEMTYNGQPVTGIYEDWNDRIVGNSYGPAGQITLGWFWFSAQDVPNPTNGDLISYRGRVWRVERLLETNGGVFKLQASTGEGVWA